MNGVRDWMFEGRTPGIAALYAYRKMTAAETLFYKKVQGVGQRCTNPSMK